MLLQVSAVVTLTLTVTKPPPPPHLPPDSLLPVVTDTLVVRRRPDGLVTLRRVWY